MGNCWGSNENENKQTPFFTGKLTSGISHTSYTTFSTNSSILSSKGEFSVSSVESVYPDGNISATPNLRDFSFQELKAATRNFKADYLLGEGGFGKVYKGWLENKYPSKNSANGLLVAIKKRKPGSFQGFEEWKSEVNFLGTLSHPNLVKLLGYCWEDQELLLVYEYMQKGSLENHLFRRDSSVQPLPWGLRLKIMIGAARGLVFLHSSNERVIYRDFKASNILLDGSYNAKMSDFGLARLGPSGSQSHVTTMVLGTYGYAAPEYVTTGRLYIRSDVYSFGVVLLEILTGERAYDTRRPSGKHNLVDWSTPYLSNKRKLKNAMDKRLGDKYPLKAAFSTAELALKCLVKEPKDRPSMQEVLDTLMKIEAMDNKP